MGFGLPAAIGAKVAYPDTQVIDIDGDGSFLMNIQELATAMQIEKIAAKVLILNNQHLGMVVQWEDRFYAGTRGHTILGDAKNIGSPDNPGGLYPDFVKIANGFGIGLPGGEARRNSAKPCARCSTTTDLTSSTSSSRTPSTCCPSSRKKKSAMEILTK
jgi:TPP-dependent trihydroxycyclohexane-1,2-dione (THcHDO) dehydratase